MSALRNPWFWIVLVAFAIHQALQRGAGVNLPLLDNYLDPFCAIPILLGLWREERKLLFGSPGLSGFDTAIATLLLALLFEEVFSRYHDDFYRDGLDYLAYALGGVYFHMLINGRSKSKATGG